MRRPFARTSLLPLALALALPHSGDAQSLTTPADWRWRLDTPARLTTAQDVPDSSWRFVGMPPGWHITTGPGVVIYHSQERATGRYSLATEFALFPHPSDAGFGLVFGGADLASPAAARLAVQLRRDGAVRVVSTTEGREQVLAPWGVHPAANPHPGTGVISNRLRVAVAPDSLRVFVNDSAVVAVTAAGLATEGQFGLRIGEGLNVHVTSLDIVRHLAPARR